jgi:hypothetical protein
MNTIIVVAAARVVATIPLFVSKRPRTSRRVIDIYLLYALVVGVGIGGLFGAVGHLMAPDRVAEQLGWATGSPFQTEVGFFDLAFGVLGICCIWFRDQWWYAVTVGWTVFAVGAGINHLRLMGESQGGALNAGSVLPDLVVPALLVVLLVVRRRLAASSGAAEASVPVRP